MPFPQEMEKCEEFYSISKMTFLLSCYLRIFISKKFKKKINENVIDHHLNISFLFDVSHIRFFVIFFGMI